MNATPVTFIIPVAVTLTTAAAAALINIWLGQRISALRYKLKVGVGDGDNEALMRRMRAQSNFAEYVPPVLILMLALEVSGASQLFLGIAGAVFLLARIAHGVGMDGGRCIAGAA
jgi:uncharacterized protein